MVTETQLYKISRPNLIRFLFVRLRSEVYERKVNTRDELLAPISDGAASTTNREDQLRRRTRDLRTRVAKYIEVDGGICEHLLRNVTNLLFLCNKFI
jgi:hypothetical protein